MILILYDLINSLTLVILKLYDLILLKEFKRQLPSEVKVHLDDKEIKDPYEASKTADDYSICHRLTRRTEVSESHFKMGGNTRSQHHKNKDNGADDSGRTKEKGKSFEKCDLSTIQCFKCREMGHYAKYCTSAENKASAFINVSKKLGPEGLSNDQKKIDSCISVEKHSMCKNLRSESNGIDDFSPFIQQGVLTLDPKSDVKLEVRILRDTGSNQTVVSKRVCQALGVSLENPEQYVMLKTVTGRTTLPVVSVYLDSESYTGLISVAVVEEMPLNGVGCILANDVMQNSTCKSELPCLLADPRRTSEGEDMENVFSCCVITRSRANKRPMVQELDNVCTVNGSGCSVMSLQKLLM